MTIDQTLQGIISLLLEIRNNTRPKGTKAISLVDMFPESPIGTAPNAPARARKSPTPASGVGPKAPAPAPVPIPNAAPVIALAPARAGITLDDVRVALVGLSTRTGNRAKSDEILAKYNARVTGDLKPEQWAGVVVACQSAG